MKNHHLIFTRFLLDMLKQNIVVWRYLKMSLRSRFEPLQYICTH